MRKIPCFFGSLLIGLLSCFLVLPVQAEDSTVNVVLPYVSANLAINTTNYSPAIDLDGYKPVNFDYSLQILVTNITTTNGCGHLALSYELSNDNAHWVSNTVLTAQVTYTNSPTSGGSAWYPIGAGISRYFRLKAVVTQTNCYLSGWLAVQ